MELKEIKELIKLVSEAGVSGVDVEKGDFKLSIKKSEEKSMFIQHSQPTNQLSNTTNTSPAAAPQVFTEKMESHNTPVVASNLITIKSPMIGTFYKSPSPDKAAFVQIGDEVKVGSVICIIEAMKLFNEIESEVSGKIVKILVENASPVEYDQPLFLVEPNS
jgi:acetyl-CoA carboxylase biotin carboxyl carrier protein